MAITLTTTSQQVSSGACIAMPNGDCLFAFGTAPTEWFPFVAQEDARFINYDGAFGSLNMKLASAGTNVSVTIATE